MGLFDFFRRAAHVPQPRLAPEWREEGVVFPLSRPLERADVESLLSVFDSASADESVLGAYLSQLVIDGTATLTQNALMLPWEAVFGLTSSPAHAGTAPLLGLPRFGSLCPILDHEASLSDPGFELRIKGWAQEGTPSPVDRIVGAVAFVSGHATLLPEAGWRVWEAIRSFSSRGEALRTQHENELAWGQIRQLADQAGAFYASPYLETTWVLTPSSLRLPLSREDTPYGRVVTVSPTFDAAPPGWLAAFDAYPSVQAHYDLTRGEPGRVRVVISEPVRRVLETIKREMPGRRVAGTRAEQFIHNPWAFLGDTTQEVIDPQCFEEDRAGMGALSAAFSVIPNVNEGRVEGVSLVVTETFSGGAARTDKHVLTQLEELEHFIDGLQRALQDERQWFGWKEYDLTLDADSPQQLEGAQQVWSLWKNQPDERIALEDVYALSEYSERIEGIGAAKAIYVPVFQKPAKEGEEDAGWLPEDLTPLIQVTLQGYDGSVLLPLTKDGVKAFAAKVAEAEAAGASTVHDDLLPTPIETSQARILADKLQDMMHLTDGVRPEGLGIRAEKRLRGEVLLVKTNFHGVDYGESHNVALSLPEDAKAVLPTSLRKGIQLKAHQLFGVAWLQHLVAKAPFACRGALLADDMGLGKTLQLLTVLGTFYERNPDAPPSIIFAPKSLLENWKNESQRFFTPDYPELLVLYGETLSSRKQPLSLIDEALKTKGIVELLKPGWVGSAKILVTTYETLIGYEFSFARQQFSFVICDEAQRIKTPGTQVTLAAKKLKTNFRIACTGTPVENSLADLWCLFDFVQPGLLGALEDFGKTYRRPIECITDAHKDALERLKRLIARQLLRRTKADIAAELKKKYFAYGGVLSGVQFKEQLEATDRLEIPISEHQRILYQGGLKKLQEASQERDGRKRSRLSFGALHLMKAVCAEPYCLPGTRFLPDTCGTDTHLANSPKLRWLLDQLENVKARREKAIIFTELREVQAALYYFLRERFGIKAFIINGDSQGRQAYIDKFSASVGFDAIILSTLAAGAGLNVTAANHVIHFTRAWNPAKENQATDRAYRIGQEKDVFVYCPTVVADDFVSFEVRLDEILRRKAGLADATIDGDRVGAMLNGTGSDASFSELVADGGVGAAVPLRVLALDDADRMDGFSFEVLTALLWEKKGSQAIVTPKKGGDGGIDVVSVQGRSGSFIQCKSSSKAEVGWDAVKEVVAGAAKYRNRYAGTQFNNLAMTNQHFTHSARDHAVANRVGLVEREELAEMLETLAVSNHEFDDALAYWLPVLDQPGINT